MRKPRIWLAAVAAGTLVAAVGYPAVSAGAAAKAVKPAVHSHVDCSKSGTLCTEVADSEQVFGQGKYVGHDEPSVLFYSNQPGSGSQMKYSGQLPTEPPPTPIPGQRSYDFMHFAAFWFGMAMCDTQSYPEQLDTCTPSSDTNITAPSNPNHAGTAFEELQFYPPGFVQQWNGFSCSATKWCVALNIDSLSINPVTGQALNAACQAKVGIEPVNFAYLTHSGKPQGPPNPVNFDPIKSGTPDPSKVLMMNQGDRYTVTLRDTPHGLQTIVKDLTTGQSGSATASAANGFGQVKFAPKGSKCINIPYDFHPMYSTSTPATRVPWAAATYNVAFDTEIGHFQYCQGVDTATGACTGREGVGNHAADADDQGCFPASASSLVKVSGCLGTNTGFDGQSYQPLWPNGNLSLRPSPLLFTSPKTGPGYDTNYTRVAFNTDLPRIEDPVCDRATGAHCTIIPMTDDNKPAAFYPYYTSGQALGGCAWTVGQSVPGFTTNDYGRNAEYGSLLNVTYVGLGGTTVHHINDFQRILPNNPCPAP